MQLSSSRVVFILAGLAWPVLILGLALLWPGPAVPDFMDELRGGRWARPVDPPVDSGSDLAVMDNGSTRIFWKVAGEGTVELTIEIDPAAGGFATPETDSLPDPVAAPSAE